MVDFIESGSIWSVMPDEIIDLIWQSKEEIKDSFSWRVLLDYGAWASWFLSSLWINAEEQYELDPLYESKDWFEQAIQRNIEWVKELLQGVEQFSKTWWLSSEIELEIWNNRRMLQVLEQSSFEAHAGITRVTDISEIPHQIDGIFITSLLSVLDNPVEFFEEIQSKLSERWVIYITEPLNYPGSYVNFLYSNIRNVKWVSVRKNNSGIGMIQIETKALKRVIVISKRFKK